MRIATSMIHDAGVSSINRQTALLLQSQQQVSTGRRILTPSDDPVAAARALEVSSASSVVGQFQKNHDNARSVLGIEEAQLSSAYDLIGRVRELTVQAGNSSLSDSDRKALAFEIRSRFEELTGIANSTDGNGQYVFSGYMGSTKPFGGSVEDILAGNEIVYQGDEGQRRLQVSATRFLEVSDSGSQVFKTIRNGNGYFTTDYGAGNTGTGIIDAGSITDPATWNALPNKDFRIDFTVDNSVTPPVTYYDIIDTSSGDSLLAGVGTAPLPPGGPPSQRVFTPGQPIVLKSQGLESPFDLGASVLIEGNPATGDSFSIAPSSSQSVFATLAHLVGVLEGATTSSAGETSKLANEIGFALTNLDQAADNLSRVRSVIGTRMNELDSLSNVSEDLQLQYQQTLSNLQDLDYAKAISDLSRQQTNLQAAQQSFARVAQLSLFNYL